MHAQEQERENVQRYKQSPEVVDRQPPPSILQNQHPPPIENDMMFSHGFEREGSRIPPLFAYHQYPAPEEIVYPLYPSAGDHYDYLAPVSGTLPCMMHFHEAIKQEDDTLSPFSLSYKSLPPMDLSQSHSSDDSYPHVSLRAIWYSWSSD
jgi:hypothetical protein